MSQQWLPLDNQFAPEIDNAFAIANKQASPALISLPVSLPVSQIKDVQ